MATKREVVTARQLAEMPDDGYRYELVRGELVKMAPSFGGHGSRAGEIAVHLGYHVKSNGLGRIFVAESGYLLASNPDLVRAPDVSFVSRERLEAMGDSWIDSFIPGPPDLAVAVLSPGNRAGEMAQRVGDYLAAGARMVVVVDPPRLLVTVHRPGLEPQVLTAADVLDGAEVVPGWRMPVAEIFE